MRDRSSSRLSVLTLWLFALPVAACNGQMNGGSEGSGPGTGMSPMGGPSTPKPGTNPTTPTNPTNPTSPTSPTPMAPSNAPPPPSANPAACTANVPGPQVIRRLTGPQYAATLRDLFQDQAVPSATVLDDPEVLGFKSDAARLVVRDLAGQQLMNHAENVARWAATTKLAQISPCQTPDSACRQQFLRAFGKRAFRAPLTDAQVKTYEGLMAAEATFADGVEVAISAMLQSPNFLYRRELGVADPANPGRFALTPYEVASNLSYLLTGSMPDAQLLAAADMNALSTRAQIDAHAERLMRDVRHEEALMRFFDGWLGLSHVLNKVKDDTIFNLTAELRADMMAETRALVTDSFGKNGTLADLLTAPHTFVNRRLATVYGINGASGNTTLTKVMLPADKRDPGILAHGSVLAGHSLADASSPVERGKLVRTRLLCQALPNPPGDLDTALKPPKGAVTTRQRFAQHSESPVCAACHKLMDPIGFGFEKYDAFGRRRETEGGQPVDATGTLSGVTGGDVNFRGLGELTTALAKTEDVRACLVRYWSYYAYGISSWADDACTQQAIITEAAQTQHTLKGVLMAIIHAPHFTRRVAGR